MDSNLTIFTMFIEGVLSFLSPCILPLIPLYIGYLTSEAKSVDSDGKVVYKRSKVMLTTCFFVFGISTVFFILGLSVSTFKNFFQEYQLVFSMVGGMVLIVMGLVHLNVLSFPLMAKEYRLPLKMDLSKMNYLKAYLLGFFFSFAWTPCIGPLLSSALIMAANASSVVLGNLYIGAYALGFILIFIMLGLFTEQILNLLKKNQKLLKQGVTLGGLILVVMGSWMLINASSDIVALQKNTPGISGGNQQEVTDGKDIEVYDFSLKDQNGVMHTLSDYEGDSVFVVFFATWCGYCKQELPIIQKLQAENDDMKVLIITRPSYGDEVDQEGLKKFIEENNYDDLTFLFDESGQVTNLYGVSGYPTSFIYRTDGSLLGYLPGAAGESVLSDLLAQTKEKGDSQN